MGTKNNWLIKGVAVLCVLVMSLGLFAGCNAECKHTYVNGVCSACRSICPHNEYRSGICIRCGIVCGHEEYENGVCAECSSECAHEEYADGTCTVCGTVCAHTEYVNGICKECSSKCSHDKYVNGACVECGTVCKHTVYSDGACTVCGIVCGHQTYENGVCKVCGKQCTHEYEDGFCKHCGGKEPQPEPEDPIYDYKPHLSARLPRIDVQATQDFISDATRNVPSFDNNNPANNIDWQYHECTVKLSNCDVEYKLEKTAGIKVRGNWTTTYPKKPFRIKFDKKQPMLGLNDGAKCKSWVLLADYKDVSLERNSLAFYLGNQIFETDGYYSSDSRQVELYLNGEYWGVYLLAEQQQVNAERINITEPETPEGEPYLGTDIGYFIEYDGYYNLEIETERFECDYAKYGPLKTRSGNRITPNQKGFAIKNDIYDITQTRFIESYMNNLYKICYEAVYNRKYYTFNGDFTGLVAYAPSTDNPVQETVSKVIDIKSLVDTYIHCEIACDYDIGWSSFLMDVDFGAGAENNLLRFEAPWDFDSAFGLRDACASGEGLFAANSANPWIIILINESWFWNMVKDKWQEMSRAGVQTSALSYVKELRTYYNSQEYKRNFDRWGFVISGESVWEIQQNVKNQSDAVDHLYNWLNKRFNYLDKQWL